MSIDITSGTIFRVIIILIGAWFLYLIFDILLMLFAAVVLATAIEPVVNWLQQRRIPRMISVALIYIMVLALLAGVLSLMVEPLVTQSQQLAQAVPSIIQVAHRFITFVPEVDRAAVVGYLQTGISRFGDNLANLGVNIFQQTRTFVSGVFTVVFVFVLTFYLVVEREALKKFVRLVTPAMHVAYAERAIDRAQQKVGKWVLAQVSLGIIIGLLVGTGLWILGVPYALLLGLIAGILEVVPYIGPVLAAIPGVAVGFTMSWVMGLVVLAMYIIIQQFEAHVLVPNIMRKAIGLHPLVTIVGILLGARLAGVVGIILSVPIATVISILLADIFVAKNNTEELPG